MASRKTYFGIGLPKDPTDPPSTVDGADQSQPTVVDDEKVAEGLKQLRSWYQGDDKPDTNAADAAAVPAPYSPPGSGPMESYARPTAVGHASGSPPAMARPMAPDPMRATLYGHDVHQFEFPPGAADTTPTPQQPPPLQHQPPTPQYQPPPPAASTALVVADPAARSREMMYRQQAEAQGAPGRSTQMPFQLAGHGEAQRLVRPGGGKPTPYPPPSSVARVPLTSKLVFAGGIAAFTGAVLIWLLSGNEPEMASAPPAPPPAPAAMVQTPPAPTPVRTVAPTQTPVPTQTQTPAPPARTPAPAPPAVQPPALPARTATAPARPIVAPSPRAPGAAPEPIPLVTEPKSERPARVRRQRAVEVEKPATDEAATTAVATSPQTDKDPAATDAKDAKDARDTKEVKAAKESKETKAAKESKSRSVDPDAPLPPSSLD